MFTGIVEEMGRVERIEERGGGAGERAGRRFWFSAARVLEDAEIGSSIAVSGVCLTVVGLEPGRFCMDAVPETLDRTILGGLRIGDPVNLERPLTLEERLGGHLVQGHVDGVGRVVSVVRDSSKAGWGKHRIRIAPPPGLMKHLAPKGSVCIDGVSLTVNDVADQPDGTCHFTLNIIPHTAEVTTLGALAAGTAVNLEIDVLARYLQRMQSLRG